MEEQQIPAKYVIALDTAKAEQTPFPTPDMSSPTINFVDFPSSVPYLVYGLKK